MSDPTPPAPLRLSGKAWLLCILLALIWSGSFTANRAAVGEVGVLTTVAFRVSGGALCLWVWILWRGLALPRSALTWAQLAGMGLLNNVIPFSLIVWGQAHIPSGLASILNAATAIFTVVLVTFFFADERLTPARAAGALTGFAGVTLIIGLDVLAALDLTSLGQLAVLAAALSYAVAGIYARAFLKGLAPEISAAGMLTGAALMMIPLALAREGAPSLDYAPSAWAALAYLGVIASAVAYFIFYAVLRIAGAGNLSLVTLMIPPFAILLGRLLFAETLAPSAYGGFALIALGLVIIDGRLSLARKSA